MIYTESLMIKGRDFTRTYSDRFMIEREGVQYSEAIDPAACGREYRETDVPLEGVPA